MCSLHVISGDVLGTQVTATLGQISGKPILGKPHLLLQSPCSPCDPFQCLCPTLVPCPPSPRSTCPASRDCHGPWPPRFPVTLLGIVMGLGEAQRTSGHGTGGSYMYLRLLLLCCFCCFFFFNYTEATFFSLPDQAGKTALNMQMKEERSRRDRAGNGDLILQRGGQGSQGHRRKAQKWRLQ